VRSKYRNIKTVVDGIKFDSKKEAKRYQELKLLEKAGEITDLELQPRFNLIVNGKKICAYIADFRYTSRDKTIIEDVKGMRTPIYKLKKKLMKACLDIDIEEV